MNGSATAFTANWNLVALVVIVPALVGGWCAVQGRVLEMATERIGFTGNYPVDRRDAPDGRIPRQGRQGVSARSR